MSIVPDIAVAQPGDLLVRPLRPAVPSTLALIEHRNKRGGLALEIVRKALLELRDPTMAAAPKLTTHKRNMRRRRAATKSQHLTNVRCFDRKPRSAVNWFYPIAGLTLVTDLAGSIPATWNSPSNAMACRTPIWPKMTDD